MVFLLPPCKAGPLSHLPCPPAPLPIHFVHYDQWCENIKASLIPTPPPDHFTSHSVEIPCLATSPSRSTHSRTFHLWDLPAYLSPLPRAHSAPATPVSWLVLRLAKYSRLRAFALALPYSQIAYSSGVCVCMCVWAHAHAHAQSLSCVLFFVTPWTAAHQSPLSMGFSQQEYWSGLPFPPPGDLPQIVKAFSFDIFKVSNTTS